jgi:hypothetical protein
LKVCSELEDTLGTTLTVLSGYKEYDTGRTYMALMGDWRSNKDEEIKLDGIGGVNIIVKADVHRSGKDWCIAVLYSGTNRSQELTSLPMHSKTRPKQKVLQKWPKGQAMKLLDCPTMLYGIMIPKKSPATQDKSLLVLKGLLDHVFTHIRSL